MVSAKVVLDAKGLVLAPGELSRSPGALVTAVNVNVEAPGIIRSRQGFAKQTNALGGPIWKLVNSKELGVNLLSNHGSSTVATGLRFGDGSSPWASIAGTVTNQPSTRMQMGISRRNHYLTSDEGVRRLETDMTMTLAGMPKGLALDLTGPSAVLSGAPGTAIADLGVVAYRVTWCKKDAEGVIMEGAPSARTVVVNNARTTGWVTGVVKDITCRILLPRQTLTASTALTTSYFYRLYRSAVAATGITPSDEMNLVAEAFLTAGNISAGYVDFLDTAPEAFRVLGTALYTNEILGGDFGPPGPSGAPLTGIQLGNNPPPWAKDVVQFARCLFYSDIIYPYVYEFTLLGTVSGTGLTAGDTLTIGGVTYTSIVPGAPTNNQFVVATVADGSANKEAVERTAQNLVEAINKSTTNATVWAFYVSSDDVLPGKIRIESRTTNTAFTLVASAHGTAYLPSLATTITATIEYHANGYAYSKPELGDAVPSVNVGFMGRADTSILRMQVLRDAIFFFTDSGIYRLTGRSSADFAVQEFDLTFRLIGREMVTTCDDAIYAWGREGIAKITGAGTEYISNAIDPLIWKTVKDAGVTWLSTYAWAASYRARHKVIFAVPDSGTNGNCPTFFVYDTRMGAWTTWATTRGSDVNQTNGHSTGVTRASDDLLFLGQWNTSGGDAYVFKERLTYAAADYKDDTYDGSDVAITKTVRWNVVTSSPELETHWDELHVLFDVSSTFAAWTTPTAYSVTFISDMASNSGGISMTPTATSRMSRCTIPRAQRRSARLSVTVSHSTVSEYFGLEGMVVVHLPGEGVATVKT